MELNANSTIKQLIESRKSLKALRTILSKRDTTIREVFNSVGYFYDRKQQSWIREEETKSDEITFQQALDQNLRSIIYIVNIFISIIMIVIKND